jgi:predicted esterase
MRTLRPLLAGAIALAMMGTLSLSGTAEDDADQPADASPGAATTEGTTTADSPGDVTIVKDLVYAVDRADAGAESKLDLYLGAGGDDAPMVVYMAGADQARGSATQLARALAERGARVLALDGPQGSGEAAVAENAAGFRAIVETVACAVRFARGSEYGSETAPLVLSGYSYGGGAASHVAIAGKDFASLWEAFGESGGPPSQVECTVDEAPTRVDALVGIVGTYDIFVGQVGKWDDEYWLEHAPDLRQMLQGTIGMHPELQVRLLAGDTDWLPFEVPAGLEAVLAEAGYDVEITEFEGGHIVPLDLTVETIMELVAS